MSIAMPTSNNRRATASICVLVLDAESETGMLLQLYVRVKSVLRVCPFQGYE